jgi:hypothetical protein
MIGTPREEMEAGESEMHKRFRHPGFCNELPKFVAKITLTLYVTQGFAPNFKRWLQNPSILTPTVLKTHVRSSLHN